MPVPTHTSADPDDLRHSAAHEPAAGEVIPSPPLMHGSPPGIGGRGNGPVLQARLLAAQRTQGNRAVQRLFTHPVLPLQREPAPTEAPDGEAETAPPDESEADADTTDDEAAALLEVAGGADHDDGEDDGEDEAEPGEEATGDESDDSTPAQPFAVGRTPRWLQRASTNKTKKKRKPKRRDIALGRTPTKSSGVGIKVLKRWHGKGKARWTGKGAPSFKGKDVGKWEVHVYLTVGAKTRGWHPLNRDIHMGHIFGAVEYWEQGASKWGITKPKYKTRYAKFMQPGHKSNTKFKDKNAREFMTLDTNYRFEKGSVNSSAGAKTGHGINYKTLPSGETQWPN